MRSLRPFLTAVAASLGRLVTPRLLGTATAEIPEDTVRAATRDALPAFETGDGEIVTSDGTFYAARDTTALAPLADCLAVLPYRPTRFDCENFAGAYRTLAAFVLGVNAVGVVYDWSASHAYTLLVDADGEARLYEPQADREVELGESDLYVGEDVLVMF
jgi:hypothetical protein